MNDIIDYIKATATLMRPDLTIYPVEFTITGISMLQIHTNGGEFFTIGNVGIDFTFIEFACNHYSDNTFFSGESISHFIIDGEIDDYDSKYLRELIMNSSHINVIDVVKGCNHGE